jgi:hypothetical protein
MLRTHGVHHYPALDTAPRRARQGICNAPPGLISFKDVEKHVDTLARSISVRDQPINSPGVVSQQFDRIAGGHIEVAKRSPEMRDRLEMGWELGRCLCRPELGLHLTNPA